ncbi:hypothetical protein [Chryseobacterium sp.]|uniref:hypothetical protein n=1 Tax=Chryseobacterium sp. TaxID=1871047 RepID=UPI002FC6B69D
MEENKLNQIIKSESFALFSELGEITLDSFTDNEILKEIPIIGTATKIFNIGNTINDRIFLNKLIKFLKQLEGFDNEVVLKEVQYIDDSKEYNQKVGEKLIEIINRIDSEEKPKIIGRLFKHFLRQKINYNQFLKLSYFIENIFLFDFLVLLKSETYQIVTNSQPDEMKCISKELISQELFSYGLIENLNPDRKPYTTREFALKNVRLTNLGMNLLEFGLKD